MHCGLTSGRCSSTFVQVLVPYCKFECTKVVTLYCGQSGRWMGQGPATEATGLRLNQLSVIASAILVQFPAICSTRNHAMLVCKCVVEDDVFKVVVFCQQIAGSQMTEPLQCSPI